MEARQPDGCISQEDGARWAVFSECRTYRYLLGRQLTALGRGEGWTTYPPGSPQAGATQDPRVCLFVMLNPSTADALKDDPTVRRCIGFAKRWGFDELRVVNLWALRTPHPRELFERQYRDGTVAAAGRLNRLYLAGQATIADRVVCAWGNHGESQGADLRFVGATERIARDRFVHLGLTAGGNPKHPLARGRHRIPDDVEPAPMFPECE